MPAPPVSAWRGPDTRRPSAARTGPTPRHGQRGARRPAPRACPALSAKGPARIRRPWTRLMGQRGRTAPRPPRGAPPPPPAARRHRRCLGRGAGRGGAPTIGAAVPPRPATHTPLPPPRSGRPAPAGGQHRPLARGRPQPVPRRPRTVRSLPALPRRRGRERPPRRAGTSAPPRPAAPPTPPVLDWHWIGMAAGTALSGEEQILAGEEVSLRQVAPPSGGGADGGFRDGQEHRGWWLCIGRGTPVQRGAQRGTPAGVPACARGGGGATACSWPWGRSARWGSW